MQQCDDNMIGFWKIDNEKRFLQVLHLNIVNRLLWFWSKFILLLLSFTNLFYFLVHVMSCQRKLSMWNLMFMKWNQERLLQLHIILSVNNQSMIKTDSSHFCFLLHTQMICACEKKIICWKILDVTQYTPLGLDSHCLFTILFNCMNSASLLMWE